MVGELRQSENNPKEDKGATKETPAPKNLTKSKVVMKAQKGAKKWDEKLRVIPKQ